MTRRFAIPSLLFAVLVALSACTTFDSPLDEDISSLHTPEMEQAIKSAQDQK